MSKVRGFSLATLMRAHGAVAAARHSHLDTRDTLEARFKYSVLPLFLLSPLAVHENMCLFETMKLFAETLLTPDFQYHGRSAGS